MTVVFTKCVDNKTTACQCQDLSELATQPDRANNERPVWPGHAD
jgi:hypothetical protein